MNGMFWIALFLIAIGVLLYHRVSLMFSTIVITLLMVVATQFLGFTVPILFSWVLFLLVFVPLNFKIVRRRYVTRRILSLYRQVMPTMSRTEREAISAGTVTWEGNLFRGNPNWASFLSLPAPQLTSEEQAFIDGPVDELCRMINDWDITHTYADLPPDMWRFIKDHGFFGLIIPKQYGGKQFSAYAHSQIIVKVSGLSGTVSTTLSVPNSLGPAELLLHYGTEEQKNYYLPRLASGVDVPCFALTSPDAGSDAGAMTDHGVVCWGELDGQRTLGIKLNFDKRYITLAPIATVIGLAFKLYDPEHLIGEKSEVGITCALIPRETPGVKIGRRHYPLNTTFQNGPIQGKNVFIPVDWIIGGVNQAGKGWKMLMECLAAGRAITLPSSALGGAKVACFTAGAYARIRRQFNLPIGRFEGIEALLARMGAFTYVMDASRKLAVQTIDEGEKPAVASAIIKYHTTELARIVACDSMDIHGGKAICLGPNNYIGRSYQAIPIIITVEGANVLTRNMIIFGQGAMRCHPYIFAELEAARLHNESQAVKAFDKAFMKHIGFVMSNLVRSLVLGLTGSQFVKAPGGKTKEYFQHITRFSSCFALLADVSMISIGAKLKRKESLSARLGDILSYLYLMSAVLKQFHDEGQQHDDLPLVRYICEYYLHETQSRFDEILQNYPNKWLSYILRALIFPLGMRFGKPKDRLNHRIAQLLMAPTCTRQRLTAGAFISPVKENLLADVQDALIKTIAAEPIEKEIRQAKKDGKINGHTLHELAQASIDKKIISVEQFDLVIQSEAANKKIIMVDDFDPSELTHGSVSSKHVMNEHHAG